MTFAELEKAVAACPEHYGPFLTRLQRRRINDELMCEAMMHPPAFNYTKYLKLLPYDDYQPGETIEYKISTGPEFSISEDFETKALVITLLHGAKQWKSKIPYSVVKLAKSISPESYNALILNEQENLLKAAKLHHSTPVDDGKKAKDYKKTAKALKESPEQTKQTKTAKPLTNDLEWLNEIVQPKADKGKWKGMIWDPGV